MFRSLAMIRIVPRGRLKPIRSLLESHFRKYRNILIQEARRLDGFMQLLMKQRNTGTKWTRNEKAQLRRYMRGMLFYVPVLFIFLLPGGFFLIPLLAEVIDRRRHSRKPMGDE